jgi:uncharacterized membrane protein YoaK (UPF0700 family)
MAVFNRRWIPVLLGFNGGYVDTVGFLALNGLFTAHVTGNFATLGAALVMGESGTIDKALALPVFCLTIGLLRLFSYFLVKIKVDAYGAMLVIKLFLLSLGALLAIQYSPFIDGNSIIAITTGLIFVAAMAIQNAVHRAHLFNNAPTTAMTLTITQVMLDVGDLLHGVNSEKKSEIYIRLKSMIPAVIIFAVGCAIGALFFNAVRMWSFLVPPVILICLIWINQAQREL